MTTKEICKSFISDIHCSAITVNPIEPVPVDDFLEEIKTLDFYHHGKDRGEGWSSVCVHGVEEQLTDHPDKYNIENPEYKWCIEDKAPILTNYFKNNFYKEIKYKRIRVMRLDPNGLIRPHTDSKKNHCYGTINIELGPTKAEYCCLCRMGKQNLDNSNIRKYQSQILQSELSYQDLIADLEIQSLNLYKNYLISKANIKSNLIRIQSIETSLETIREEYMIGTKTSTDLIEIESELLSVNVNYFDARKDFILNYFQIKALEGSLIDLFENYLTDSN